MELLDAGNTETYGHPVPTKVPLGHKAGKAILVSGHDLIDLEKRAADIIMPDFQKCGGLLEARKIADMAHTYYVPVAPHAVTSPIGMMATAHVCAAIPNFLVQEWHWIDSLDLWRNWVKEGEIIQKGYIPIPERPGIGVEMNDDGARKAQVPGTPWFEPTRRG